MLCFIQIVNAQKGHKNPIKKKDTIVALLEGPRIFVESQEIDYGKINKGSDGTRTFLVKNIGNKPLLITACQSNCGCLTPTCPREPIMPGKSAKVEAHYFNTNTIGIFNKNIKIMSNDPITPSLVITIKGEVVEETSENVAKVTNGPRIHVDISAVDYGKYKINFSPTRSITVKNIGNEPLVLTNCTSSCCIIPNCPREPIMPGKSAVISLYNSIGARLGVFSKQIGITSNDPMTPTLLIPVKGEVMEESNSENVAKATNGPRIQVDTPTVDYGKYKINFSPMRSITVKNIGNEPLLLTMCSTTCCFIPACPREPIMPGKSSIITLHNSISHIVGRINKQIIIRSNDPMTPTLLIPVKGEGIE